jgi:hypothetical protein
VLTPCRGRRPHHVQKDRIGSWEVSRLAIDVEWVPSTMFRIGKARSRVAIEERVKRREAETVERKTYSITSSTRASNVSGIVRPIALAVLRLTIKLNLVGCITGRSAGFTPLNIRATY